MKFIIIDDEPGSRIFLQEIMLQSFGDWKLLGVCSSVSEGIEAINKLKPDLVLLDIEIAEGTAFDILDVFENPEFRIIFISAHEHYALKAIKYAALDYILKPVNVKELEQALKKVASSANSSLRLQTLRQNLVHENSPANIIVPTAKGYQVVGLHDIAFIEASGPYVYINLSDKQRILATHSLGYYEELLGPKSFFRVHKSFLVNIFKVSRILTKPSPKLELTNNETIDLAVRRKEAFMELFKKVHNH